MIVEEVIKNGAASPDPRPNNIRYYDQVNKIVVIIDKASGRVVSIRDGIVQS